MQRRSLLAACALIPMLGCAAISIGNLFFGLFTFPAYADYSWVADFIAKSTPAPRWLIHQKMQAVTFHTLESMFFAREFLPRFVHDPLSFARALNVLLLVAAGLHCYARYPQSRGTVAFVISSAAYCFMATGYAKVYGAATAVLLVLYCTLDESDFGHQGIALGVMSALVGLYYLALMPIAFAILIATLMMRTRAFLPAVLSFVLAVYVLVTVFWGHDVAGYFASLWAESHFGNPYTAYGPYRGQASSDNSIFFTPSFLFSAKHLADKLYMLFFSGTLLSFCGACYESVRFIAGGRRLPERIGGLKAMTVFCCLSWGACLIILSGYLSKIGPRMDLPFYAPYIVPFTFVWLHLRTARGAADISSSRSIWIAQAAYAAVIVVWSGMVGPPDI